MQRLRLLPLTMAAMTLVLGAKAVDLAHALRKGVPDVKLVSSAAAAPAAAPAPMPKPAPVAAQARIGPVAAPSGAPPVSDSERAVLLALRQRREQLDAREAQVASREMVLAASARRLDARLDELTALQSRLEALETARRQRDEANWAGLVKLYESMKPRDAAVIFNDLDMAVMLPVVDRMKETKAAAILAAMDAAKARVLTANLAQSRLRANSIDAGKGS